MKLFALIGTLVAGVACLRTSEEEHQLTSAEEPEHLLFFKCRRIGGEKCGTLWRSCCQKGYCTKTAIGAKYCPDGHQLNT